MVSINCQICHKVFEIYPSWISKRKTCSKDCAKQLFSQKTCELNPMFGRRHTSIAKSKMVKAKIGLLGINTNRWLGDKAGYGAIHSWIRKILGEPDTCEICRASGLYGRKIHWANISGEYHRDSGDWIRLCASCHKGYDKNRVTAKKLFKLTNCGYAERRLTSREI